MKLPLPPKRPYYTFEDTRARGTGRLGIQVHPTGNKVFVFRYKRGDKWAFVRLGNFPSLKLAEAREKAKLLSQLIP